jgi:dTDP-4-amino-4,6-dideoxygalactose transaminase
MSMPPRESLSSERPALLGGEPACQRPWPVWPVHDFEEESRLLDVLHSGQWWYGAKVQQFEGEFAAFQGARYAVTCTNGTTALEMGLRALGVVEGDEVIVPPYSFVATASAVITVGAIPVFADILPDTLCLDPDDVERKITPRTRAIVPVHVAGLIADMQRINALAAAHQLVVLEDAAHAWGSQWRERGAGTLGRAGTFSFQVTKNITAGEGGVLVTDEEDLADLCRSFSHCGRRKNSPWYSHDLLGSNLRMTEFQAAILVAQLTRLDDQIRRRAENAAILDQSLRGVHGLHVLDPGAEMTRRSYHLYIFRVDQQELGLTRDQFVTALNAEGVPASIGWYQPLYRNGLFQSAHQGPAHGIRAPLANKAVDYRETCCPVCEQVCRDAVWIPQHVLLAGTDQIHRLVGAIDKVVNHSDALRRASATQKRD